MKSTGSVVTHLICFITVRHGSADTVVRAMNDFNGKFTCIRHYVCIVHIGLLYENAQLFSLEY